MSQDFKQARFSTHEKLVGKLKSLSHGDDIKSLASFAKAYLGMYLDIDSELSPVERVSLLVDEDILDSIWAGFDAVLHGEDILSPEEIGRLFVKDERSSQGYIVLAAIDKVIADHSGKLEEVLTEDRLLESLVCFHYVDRNDLKNQWLDHLVQHRPQLVSSALLRFWQSISASGVERYPGFREILQKAEFSSVLKNIALPVLKNIPHLNRKLLPVLLQSAFQYVPHRDLFQACQFRLADDADMSVRQHVYWLGSAYLLAPVEYEAVLFDYVGRTREKALPLLNFVEQIIKNRKDCQLEVSANMLASLLYMIAPKFRPGRDRFGRLDDNVLKIVWLFNLLGQYADADGRQAILRLRKIRVMRLYSEFLDMAEQTQLDLR